MDYRQALYDLCAIYTQTGHGGGENFSKVCRNILGDDVEMRFRPSASIGCGDDIIFTRKGSGTKRVLLLGHYDTVPAAGNHKLKEDGDRIIGLGTWDMKGGIVLALDLLQYPDETSFETIDLLLTADEESRTGIFQPPGVYDACLAFEGGEHAGVVISRFGAGVLEIEISGSALRAEFPLPRPGGIDAAFDLYHDLKMQNTPEIQFTASNVSAKSVINVVPGEVSLSGVLRYTNIQERDIFLESLEKEHYGFHVQHSFREVMPPLFASRASKQFCSDLEIYGVTRTGASDICWMNDSARLLFDGLGPFGGEDHTPDEYIKLSSFERQARLGQKILDRVLAL